MLRDRESEGLEEGLGPNDGVIGAGGLSKTVKPEFYHKQTPAGSTVSERLEGWAQRLLTAQWQIP